MKPHPVDWIDFDALLRRLRVLPVFADTPEGSKRVFLNIGRSGRSSGVSGNANNLTRRLRIVVPQFAHAAEILEVLLHELVHLALPHETHHDERFRRTLARAAREAWGIDVDPNPAAGVWKDGKPKISAYVLDDQIRAALGPLVESGAVTFPTPAPVTKPTRAAATEALIARRADHAAKMLARAERRLRQARTIAKKWHQKVAYYERVAAKRGGS